MVYKMHPIEIEVHLEHYDKLARYQPENCLYCYGRKVFGYVENGIRYDIDHDVITMRENFGDNLGYFKR